MKTTKSIMKVTATAAMATAMVANYALPVFAEENTSEANEVNFNQSLNQVKLNLESAKRSFDDAKKELDEKAEKLKIAKVKFEKASNNFANAQKALADAEKSAVTEEDVKKAEVAMEEAKKKAEFSKKELDEAKANYNNKVEDYDNAESDLKKFNKSIENKTQEVVVLKEQIQRYENELSSLKENLKEEEKAEIKYNEEYLKVKDEYDQLVNENQSVLDDYSYYKGYKEVKEGEIRLLEDPKKEAEIKVINAQNWVEMSKEQLEKEEELAQEANQKLEETNKKITDLQLEIDRTKALMDGLDPESDTYKSLQSNIDNLTSNLQAYEETAKEQKLTLIDLNVNVRDAQKAYDSNAYALKTAQNELDEINKKIDEANAMISDFDDKLNKLQETVDAISNKENDVNIANSNWFMASYNISNLNMEIQHTESIINDNTQILRTTQDDIEILKEQKKDLEEDINKKKQEKEYAHTTYLSTINKYEYDSKAFDNAKNNIPTVTNLDGLKENVINSKNIYDEKYSELTTAVMGYSIAEESYNKANIIYNFTKATYDKLVADSKKDDSTKPSDTIVDDSTTKPSTKPGDSTKKDDKKGSTTGSGKKAVVDTSTNSDGVDYAGYNAALITTMALVGYGIMRFRCKMSD